MATTAWPEPWPIDAVVEALRQNDTLAHIVGARRDVDGHDVRENSFERLVDGIMRQEFGDEHVVLRKPVRSTLGLTDRRFPDTAQPDIAVRSGGKTHFCELKSSRVDYARFDDVLDSKAFLACLEGLGHRGAAPWEVEQDLIKLRLFGELSREVGSCVFVMLDAYSGPGRSWTACFSDRRTFEATVRTALVRGWASELLAATRIQPVSATGATANLIVCEVAR